MQKEARKAAINPEQEHLRQQKDQWNKACSLLIASLISFKKGFNGRGDPRNGLPPSKIHHPLPPEVLTLLDKLVGGFNQLLHEAENIADEQKHYSESRMSPKMASWMGSRAWAHLFLRTKHRKQLLEILSSSANLHKYFKQLENLFSSNEPIPKIVNSLERLVRIFLIRVLDKINVIQESAKELPITEKPTEEIAESFQLDFFEKEIPWMDIILKYLKSKFAEEAKDQINQLESTKDYLQESFKKKEFNQSKINDLYQLALSGAKDILQQPKANNFEELVGLIKIAQIKKDIEKTAINPVSKWFARQKLRISPNEEDQIKLSSIKDIRQILKSLQNLMDGIENKESEIESLQKKTAIVGVNVYQLISKTIELARIYNTQAEDQKIELGRQAEIKKIPTTVINNLRNLKQELQGKLTN